MNETWQIKKAQCGRMHVRENEGPPPAAAPSAPRGPAHPLTCTGWGVHGLTDGR